VRGAKGKGKETNEGGGKRRCAPKKAVPPGIDWPGTNSRFCAEMAKMHFNRPTGEVLTPEMAYARSTKFIKEDLYLSVSDFFYCDRDHHLTNLFIWCQPLVAGSLGERPWRDLDQYLTAILKELRPWRSGQRRGVRYMLERGKRTTHLHTKLMPTKPHFPQWRTSSRESSSS